MCFLLLSEPKFLHISCKSFIDKDHVQLSDSEAKWQSRNKCSCSQHPPFTWMVPHWHTGARKEHKCIIVHKIRCVEGWTNLTGIWKPPLKTQFREGLICFVVPGTKMLRTFHRCSGLCLDVTLEMPVAQLRAVGMIYTALRGATVLQGSFIRSKQQPGGWGMLDLNHCSSFTLMWSCPQSCHVSLFIFLLLGMFWSSCYMWLFMVILWEAAICLL